MNLAPRQLRMFVLLADTLSFHRAAQQLHVTQPTLSKLVREMEDTIGVRLFERTTRVVRLTRDGQDLLPLARRVAGQFAEGLLAFEELVRHRTRRVAIAALPTLAATLLPALVVRLRQDAPELQLAVFDLVADEALALLRSRRVDLAMTAMGEVPPDLRYTELFTEPFVLFHAAQRRIALAHWSTQELAQLPLISMPPGTSTRELVEARFEADRRAFAPVFSLRDLNTIARFVQADCGVALLPQSAAQPFLGADLAISPLQGAPTRSIGIFTRKEAAPPDPVARVLRELQRLAAGPGQRVRAGAPSPP